MPNEPQPHDSLHQRNSPKNYHSVKQETGSLKNRDTIALAIVHLKPSAGENMGGVGFLALIGSHWIASGSSHWRLKFYYCLVFEMAFFKFTFRLAMSSGISKRAIGALLYF